MKLLLYSHYVLHDPHRAALMGLVGKDPRGIRIAAIQNATDVESDTSEWLAESTNALATDGASIDVVDLRTYLEHSAGLRERLAAADVIWICGGNGFYLRWILKASTADDLIRELVRAGTVYAGWSAGAVIAGPTLESFELVEDLTPVPEVLHDALGLTQTVVLPHMDLDEFAAGMRQVGAALRPRGYRCVELVEAQALLIDGDDERII
jgi:dipeptidase E